MTTYEIICTIILWLSLGAFINHKCGFFKDCDEDGEKFLIVMLFAFAPLAFAVMAFILLFVNDWDFD